MNPVELGLSYKRQMSGEALGQPLPGGRTEAFGGASHPGLHKLSCSSHEANTRRGWGDCTRYWPTREEASFVT